jgi:hypothetical protein
MVGFPHATLPQQQQQKIVNYSNHSRKQRLTEIMPKRTEMSANLHCSKRQYLVCKGSQKYCSVRKSKNLEWK